MTRTTSTSQMRRRVSLLVCAALVAVGVSVAASAASAGQTSVGSIAVTASPNPASRPGASITLTNTGATNPDPNASTLIYDYYQPGVAACATTAANERSLTHGSGFITTIEQNTSASFSDQTSFVPVGGVRYRICAYLYSGGDDSVAPDAIGTTLLSVPGPPTAITGQASPMHAATASVHGRANPDGAATTYYFQYGPTGRYGSRTSIQTVGTGFSDRPLSASLPALKRQSTYHYRIVATNRFGTTRGHDRTLHTGR
jgi:hypothetical protein